jgi:hypothetical protein
MLADRDAGGATLRTLVAAATFSALLSLAAPARANPEPPATYDARVVGMGGTAVAYLQGPAALYHTPAGLDGIEGFEISASLTNLMVRFRAPFAGAGSETTSDMNYAPLFFLGGGARVSKRLTVGLGAYISTGFGGGFQRLSRIGTGTGTCIDDPVTGVHDDNGTDYCPETPLNQTVFLVVGELALPVAVRVTDTFRLGLALRLPYAQEAVRAVQEVQPAVYQAVEQDVSGLGIPGVLLGAQWDATPWLSLGFSYRSKVWIDMRGQTTLEVLGTPTSFPTRTRWSVPHAFRFGAALRALQRRLLLTAELKIQLHQEANKRQVFHLRDAGPSLGTITADFNWRNVYLLSAGAEFMALPWFALRLGFSGSRSATPRATVTPFTPPPGILIAAYGGLGVRGETVDVDLGFAWGGGAAVQIAENGPNCQPGDRVKYGCSGSYDVNSYFLSISAIWRR